MFIFPTGPLNEPEQVRYVGTAPARETTPTNLDIETNPQSIADLVMSDHRLIMRGNRTYMRPTHWMRNYSPEDSGNLVGLDVFGGVVSTERNPAVRIGEGGERVYDANQSVFTFPQEMDLGENSRELAEEWNRAGGVLDTEGPLLRLANHIYAALHINTFEENAQFYLSFRRNLSYVPYLVDRGGEDRDASMLVVKMSSKTRVQETEAKYIALMIARRFTKYTQKYGEDQASIMEVLIRDVGIKQYLNTGEYDPVIRAGPVVEMIMDLASDAMDVTPKAQFARLKKSLGTSYQLTSPGSYKHCVIKATILALKGVRFETMSRADKNRLKGNAHDITKSRNLTGRPHTIMETTNALKNHNFSRTAGGEYKVSFTTLGGKVINTITSPGLSRRIRTKRVVIYGGHALAVVPRKPSEEGEEEDVAKPMEPKSINASTIPPLIGTWDMETTADGTHPYMVGFTLDGITCKQLHGLNCVDDFLKELEAQLSVMYPPSEEGRNNTVYLFAHNGGKFDVPIIMDRLREEAGKNDGDRAFILLGGKRFMERDNRLFKVTIRFPKIKVHVEFRDSVPHINTSLDKLCVLYGVENPKLGGVDHSKITQANFEEQIIEQHLEAYLDNDVLGLYQGLTKYGEGVRESVGFNPIEMGLMTASAIPKRVFLAEYLEVADRESLKACDTEEEREALKAAAEMRRPWQLSNAQDQYVRAAYHGGRCDVFYRGEWDGPLSYVDFVSMYPSVMVKEDMPMGAPRWHPSVESLEDFWGFVRIMVRGGNDHMNGIRIKTHNGGLVAPKLTDWTEVTIFSEELRGILEMNDFFHYEVKYLDGISFDHGPYMRDITLKFYQDKQDAKKEKEEEEARTGIPASNVKYALAKANVNSVYGHFAFKMWATSLRLLDSKRDMEVLMESGHLLETYGRFALVRERQKSDIRAVQVAAAVTAFAHLKLLRYMVGIEQAGFKVLYCDTDSVVTNMMDIDAYEQTGKALGQMDYEFHGITSGVFLAPKIYGLRADHDHIKIKGISKGPYLTREETDEGVHFRGRNMPGADIMVGYDDLCAMLTKPLLATVNRFHTGKRKVMRRGPGVVIKQQTNRITGRLLKGNAGEGGEVKALVGHGCVFYSFHFKCGRK